MSLHDGIFFSISVRVGKFVGLVSLERWGRRTEGEECGMSDLSFGGRYSEVDVLEQNELGTHAIATIAETGENVFVTRLSDAAASSEALGMLMDKAQGLMTALPEVWHPSHPLPILMMVARSLNGHLQ